MDPAQDSVLEVAAATAQSLAARGKEVQLQLADAAETTTTAPVVVDDGQKKAGEIEDEVEKEVPPLPPSEVKVYPASGKEQDETEKNE